MDGELNYISRTLDAARQAFATAHPEESRLLPFGTSAEYHIINALQSLVTEVEALQERVAELEDPTRWTSNAGAVEVASDDDYEGERVDVAWADYPNPDTRLTDG